MPSPLICEGDTRRSLVTGKGKEPGMNVLRRRWKVVIYGVIAALAWIYIKISMRKVFADWND